MVPAGAFAPLVGVSKHTLYAWKKKFDEEGPAGLMDKRKGHPAGSRLPEVTRRTILMLKEAHPDWGCQRISDMLLRGPALPASPAAVARVLHEAGYQSEETPTRNHEPKVTSFERARPNQLWQTDLFTFILKRQNRRVYLVAFMDDHSRFLVGYGLHASQSTALVLEVLRAAITGFGTPEEVLTDNGTQYITWRGKSAFTRECEKRGIRQIVAKPHSYLLAVRDVCTGEQLLWLPVIEATGEVARDALATLFAEHGPPLVLKSDNGSPFTGSVVQKFLETHSVESLLSPPYWPAYNGAVEAGIGSLKDRTDASAARAGHPGYWTCDDVARARLEANTLGRPNGENRPCPDAAWQSRTAITDEERMAF